MSERKWFTPAEGLSIVDPATRKTCPARGQWVFAGDEFYLRRELAGDGTLGDTAPADADRDD